MLKLSVREYHDPQLCSKFNLSQTAWLCESLCKTMAGMSKRVGLWSCEMARLT